VTIRDAMTESVMVILASVRFT